MKFTPMDELDHYVLVADGSGLNGLCIRVTLQDTITLVTWALQPSDGLVIVLVSCCLAMSLFVIVIRS